MSIPTQPELTGDDTGRRDYGRYRTLGTLGTGGMGIVLAAHDPDLERPVALKILHPEAADAIEGGLAATLTREARVMARVAHPNVVTVYEVGAFDDQIFIAMELVDGTTLRGWVEARPRTWRELVAMYVEAGGGLVAAHEHGLVHRDFKPDNVLIGADGRPRVTDFGLAADTGDTPLALADDEVEPTTRTAVGTPAYMSPEQWARGAIDPRTDQFAFCVAMWEALHGQRPFAGSRASELREAVCSGRISAPGRSIPRWLDAALRRGLSPDPADRWPDVASLLAVLRRRARRRRWTVVAGAGAAGAVLAAAAVMAATLPAEPAAAACSLVAAPFEAMWDATERARIERGFLASGSPIAGATWEKLGPAIDRWGAAWTAMRRETCEATEVRREQSAALLDARMSCLEDRRRELGGLLNAFAAATPAIVRGAVRSLVDLDPIAHCADAVALTAIAPPPRDQALQIAAIKAELAELAAARRFGRTGDSIERARRAVAAARSLAYPPLEGEALFELGLAENVGGKYEDALRDLEAATLAADRGGDDRLRARAWNEAMYVAGFQLKRRDTTQRAYELSLAALSRLREPGALAGKFRIYAASAKLALGNYAEGLTEVEAALALPEIKTGQLIHAVTLGIKASLLGALHRYDEAIACYREGRPMLVAELGADHPNVASFDASMASTMLSRGDESAEIERMLRASLAVGERALGPDHPQVATYAAMLSYQLLAAERFSEALPLARRVVKIRETDLPPDHPRTIRALVELALVLRGLERAAEAEPLLVRCAEMAARRPLPDDDLADVRYAHGLNLIDLGRPADAARELAAARELYARTPQPDPAVLADALAWEARAVIEAGDPRRGLAQADAAIVQALPAGKPDVEGLARWSRARALLALGRRGDAIRELADARAVLTRRPRDDARRLLVKLERWRTERALP